jgi:hypothetical protein
MRVGLHTPPWKLSVGFRWSFISSALALPFGDFSVVVNAAIWSSPPILHWLSCGSEFGNHFSAPNKNANRKILTNKCNNRSIRLSGNPPRGLRQKMASRSFSFSELCMFLMGQSYSSSAFGFWPNAKRRRPKAHFTPDETPHALSLRPWPARPNRPRSSPNRR